MCEAVNEIKISLHLSRFNSKVWHGNYRLITALAVTQKEKKNLSPDLKIKCFIPRKALKENPVWQFSYHFWP